jgi:hypothetical protein
VPGDGLVNVGVVAVDGTKVHANASNLVNRDYRQIAEEIIAEHGRVDREEEELYGQARGDELPAHLRPAEGRRAALREAKRKLAVRRAGQGTSRSQESERVDIPPDPTRRAALASLPSALVSLTFSGRQPG